MNGGGCCTTRTWPPPSSTGSWNEEDSSASMDPRDGHVISNWRTPCQTVQNGSEYLEKTAQNFRNPHRTVKPTENGTGGNVQFTCPCQKLKSTMRSGSPDSCEMQYTLFLLSWRNPSRLGDDLSFRIDCTI